MGRTVLDVLVSAPPLWAERLEEVMRGIPVRRGVGLWLADQGLALGGLALLALGAAGRPHALLLGWTALALAFFGWVAEADGIALPRPGRAVIRTYGCWETPLAFSVRHRDAVLLFSRDEEVDGGAWSDLYTVRQRPDGGDVDPQWDLPLTPGSEWLLRCRIPIAALTFEHHERVAYVTRGSLVRALSSTAMPRLSGPSCT